MFQHEYRLLSLIDSAQKIHGRKRFQKIVYLLKMTGTDLPYKFHFHDYGPYSFELDQTINHMIHHGLLQETKPDRFVYALTKQGRQFKTHLKNEMNASFSVDPDLLNNLINEPLSLLEAFSSHVFLMFYGHTYQEADERLVALKPDLSEWIPDISRAYDKYNLLADE